jgi:hypothetical protein
LQRKHLLRADARSGWFHKYKWVTQRCKITTVPLIFRTKLIDC